MPYIERSSYKSPAWLPGGHAQTIFPSLFRRVPQLPFTRLALDTPDGDFILLDRIQAGRSRASTVVILSHGLEGDSRRKYIRGMSLACLERGWDCIARNFRACGGKMNRLPVMYHSGQTDDVHSVVLFALDQGYERILLTGYSMGGNQVLKYLGENPERVPPEVRGAAVFSVPCHLPGSAKVLDMPSNTVYMRYFMRTLRHKVREKHKRFPELYPLEGLERMRTFAEFDNAYTAPVHGFASARDYWAKASCLPHLASLGTPVLLVNARNDPFLSPECFPVALAQSSPFLLLETPAHGGHVGFTSPLGTAAYWSETRAVAYFDDILKGS